MKINITFRHLDPTEAAKGRVRERLEKIEKHFPRHVDATVILSAEKHRQAAEIELVSARVVLFARAETDDLFAAIDQAADAIGKQAKKHREKLVDHHNEAREAKEALGELTA